jgi:hypothetical protein
MDDEYLRYREQGNAAADALPHVPLPMVRIPREHRAELPRLTVPQPQPRERVYPMQDGGGVMAEDDFRPFVIERPGKNGRIKLGPEAKYWAEQHGMTLQEMARYLLQRDEQGDAQAMIGGESESGDATPTEEQILEASRDLLPDVTPSENIEDRRGEPEYADTTMRRIWGQVPPVAPQAQTFGVNPLSRALGFQDVGRPAPSPQILGPTAPSWPAPFGSYQHDVPLPVD